MKRRFCIIPFVLILTIAIPVFLAGKIDINDTKLLSQPAISKTHIAFVYAGDLWAAGIDGKGVRRLTTAQGLESNPVFSPDFLLKAVFQSGSPGILVPMLCVASRLIALQCCLYLPVLFLPGVIPSFLLYLSTADIPPL